jgi:hypothetical protein
VLRLSERHEPPQLEAACQQALAAGDGRLRTVRGLLECGLEHAAPEEAAELSATAAHAFLRGPAAFAVVPAAGTGQAETVRKEALAW